LMTSPTPSAHKTIRITLTDEGARLFRLFLLHTGLIEVPILSAGLDSYKHTLSGFDFLIEETA